MASTWMTLCGAGDHAPVFRHIVYSIGQSGRPLRLRGDVTGRSTLHRHHPGVPLGRRIRRPHFHDAPFAWRRSTRSSRGRTDATGVRSATGRSGVRVGVLRGDFGGRWLLAGREGPLSGRRIGRGNVRISPRSPAYSPASKDSRGAASPCAGRSFRPGWPWIPLNVAILPAADPAPSGALFHLAGGPGQAATDQAADNARRFARIRDHRDLVMVDQRGTGASNPLRCPDLGPVAGARVLLAWDLPGAWIRECAAGLRRRANLRRYTTTEAAADIEAVRQWLGYPRIDLYGGSYGTRTALEVARNYPSHVRTLTLRAVMSPAALMATGEPVALDAALNHLFRDCGSEAACQEAYPNLEKRYRELVARLGRHADSVSVLDPGTGDSIRFGVDRDLLAGALRRMMMNRGRPGPRAPGPGGSGRR